MCTNGWIAFGADQGSNDLTPGNAFTTAVVNRAIRAWHGDGNANFGITTPNGVGSMQWGVDGTGDRYVFQWNNNSGAGSGSTSATASINYQIVLDGPSSATPGRIRIIYGASTGTITTGRSIAIEDAVGGTGRYINALNGLSNSTTTSSAWPGNGAGYQFDAPVPCSGTPNAGTVTSPVAVCTGSTAVLTATGLTTGLNISYQWQESPDGSTGWASVVGGSGATTASYTTTAITSTRYFRLQTTCSTGPNTNETNVVTVNAISPTYATFNGTSFAESFEGWSNLCNTTDVPTTNWKNDPATGNNSWRRNDQGTSAAWTSTSGAYSPVSTQGSFSARFHSFNASSGSKGNLDLYIDMTAGSGNNGLTFDYINTNGGDSLTILQSTNGGATFTRLGAILTTAGAWTAVSRTITSTSATTVIRLRATSDFGNTDIGVDNLNITSPCSGTPNAGSASATPASPCPGNTTVISATGLTIGSGISYQWEESPDGIGSWASVVGGTGATTAAYTTTAINATRYFRLTTTCSTGPSTNSTNVVTVNPSAGSFAEDFSSGSITTNCWSQSGTGTAANLRYNAASAFGVGTGSIIWDFFTQSANATLIYTSPVITPTSAGQEIAFDVAGRQYAIATIDSIYLEASSDGGTTWSIVVAGSNEVGSAFNSLPINTTELNTPLAGEWASRSYVLPTGTDRVRFRGVSKFGNNVLVDNIALPVACAGPVDPGATESTSVLACTGANFTLSLENATVGSGVSYQWYASTTSASGPFDITGPTTATWTTSQSVPTWYYCTVTCVNGPATGDSDVLAVAQDVPTNCYCTPTYTDGKTDGDLLSNVVIVGTTLANNTGTAPVNPAYTYFNTLPNHTASLQAGTSYTIQASVGTFGSQNIAVWIDFNEDGVFSTPSERVGFTTTVIAANGTGTFTLTLPCDPTPGLKRMRVRDVYSTSSIGSTMDPCINYGYGETEDYDVTILAPPACPAPSGLAFNTVTFNSANITWNIGCTETAWEIEYGPTGFTLGTGTVVPATSPFALTGLNSSFGYHVYVRADCGDDGVSASVGPVSFTTLVAPPANDLCANAIPLNCNSTVTGNTNTAGNTGAPATCSNYTNNGTRGVWYTIQGWDGPMTASLCGSSYDTQIGIFTGSCGSFTCVAGNDDSNTCTTTSRSYVTWTGSSSATYYVYVTGWNAASGAFELSVSCGSTNPTCTSNGLNLEFQTDGNPGQVTWEILNAGNLVVLSGANPVPSNSIGTQAICLPNGCYRLRVLDSGGDGMTTGGYELRTSANDRIIDNTNNFSTGSVSAISGNQTFCLPIGTDKLIFSSCDKLDWVANKFIVASANPAVSAEFGVTNATSGYEFWFYDPNGSFSYRRFRSHATSDGFGTGATRACHFKVNGWFQNVNNPHLPANVLLNVRIRGRVAGNNLEFGPACQFKIDPTLAACPRVSLQDNPANTSDFSCGVFRNFGGSGSAANRIYANPPQPIPTVSSANVRYQFRFRITGEGICIVRPPQTSAQLTMNWTTGQLLECSKTYEVDVRVSLDGGATWCFGPATSDAASACADTEAWGKVCNVTINPCALPNGGGNSMVVEGNSTFTMYPNPNRGDQLFMSVSSVEEGVSTVSVDIFDLTGKRVMARTIAVQDGFINTNLELNGDLAGGLYMVNVTAGTKAYTERLVIQP